MSNTKSRHNFRDRITINYKSLWVNSVLLVLIVYFCYHSFSGQRGFIAFLKLNKDIKSRTIELTSLKKERESLENKVKLLYPNSLDLDMLDELARREMGLIEKDEKVLILSK